MASSESQLDWEAQRSRIANLYWNQGKKLPEVMGVMKTQYGFLASKKLYKKHLKAWGLEKNLKATEAMAMLRIAEQRRLVNKETLFMRHSRPVEPAKLRRFAKRHNFSTHTTAASPSDKVSTPPGITYTTPESEPEAGPRSDPPPSVPRQFCGSKSSEASQEESMAGVSWSYDPGNDVSPPDRGASWASPAPMLGPSEYGYPDPQVSTHDAVSAHPMPDAPHGRHQMPVLLDNIPQNSSGLGFYAPPLLVVAPLLAPLQVYQSSSDGALSWTALQQLPPYGDYSPRDGASQGSPALPAVLSPSKRHAMVGMAGDRGNLRQAHDINGIAGVAGILDHSPLHDAVTSNNVALSKCLLEGGHNPNCAARGGMTPLHYAAYQRNVDLVVLLLKYGANFDAVTDGGRSILFFAVRDRYHMGQGDLLAYQRDNHGGSGSHSDEDTLHVIDALFSSPSRWAHLLRGLDKADKDGTTPLMVAAEEGFHKTATMLLKRGARPAARDRAGHTALRYAAKRNHQDLVRLLLLADPGISCDRDLPHILKLASNNFTASSRSGSAQPARGLDDGIASALIAQEMVRVCQSLGLLDDLLALAEQRGKTTVLELLRAAASRPEMEQAGSREP